MKTIIFDFNRTLFDPDTGGLVDGALLALEHFSKQGACLCLVSRQEAGRGDVLESLGIAKFFKEVAFVEEKNKELFEDIMAKVGADHGNTYVVGDYLHSEIRVGNELGLKTIWYRQGAFAHLEPETSRERPWRTIEDMKKLMEII